MYDGFAQITSSDSMILSLKYIICKLCSINNKSINIRKHPTSKGISILMICSFPSMLLFRDFLYKDATIFLGRKKTVFYNLNLNKIKTELKSYEKELLSIFKDNPVSNIDLKVLGYSKYIISRTIESLLNKKIIYISETRGSGRRKYFKLL